MLRKLVWDPGCWAVESRVSATIFFLQTIGKEKYWKEFEAIFFELIKTARLVQTLLHGKHVPTSFPVRISEMRLNMTLTT